MVCIDVIVFSCRILNSIKGLPDIKMRSLPICLFFSKLLVLLNGDIKFERHLGYFVPE